MQDQLPEGYRPIKGLKWSKAKTKVRSAHSKAVTNLKAEAKAKGEPLKIFMRALILAGTNPTADTWLENKRS